MTSWDNLWLFSHMKLQHGSIKRPCKAASFIVLTHTLIERLHLVRKARKAFLHLGATNYCHRKMLETSYLQALIYKEIQMK